LRGRSVYVCFCLLSGWVIIFHNGYAPNVLGEIKRMGILLNHKFGGSTWALSIWQALLYLFYSWDVFSRYSLKSSSCSRYKSEITSNLAASCIVMQLEFRRLTFIDLMMSACKACSRTMSNVSLGVSLFWGAWFVNFKCPYFFFFHDSLDLLENYRRHRGVLLVTPSVEGIILSLS